MNVWYGRQMRENMNQEILKRNEASLMQASSNVNSVILSMKNLAYSLSANANVKYLASISSASGDATENWNSLSEMLSVLGTANDYIDSIYVYFANSGSVISQSGDVYKRQQKDTLEISKRTKASGVLTTAQRKKCIKSSCCMRSAGTF